jgi:glucose/arabinose dehydrogenase
MEGNAALAQSGGRIARASTAITGIKKAQQFFFSVGDFLLSPSEMKALPLKTRKYLAAAMLFTGPQEYQIWAKGLRNAQGLTTAVVEGKPVLVATLHGPRGGDEINVVEKGGDYGWPNYSYGTAYGLDQPQNTANNQGYSSQKYPPLFAWVPSIGPTSVLQVKGSAYLSWWGNRKNTSDLIVNGMGSNWLYRLRVDDGAVRYVEPIFIGVRLRTLIQMPSGLLVGGIDKSSSELIVFNPVSIWRPVGGFFAR